MVVVLAKQKPRLIDNLSNIVRITTGYGGGGDEIFIGLDRDGELNVWTPDKENIRRLRLPDIPELFGRRVIDVHYVSSARSYLMLLLDTSTVINLVIYGIYVNGKLDYLIDDEILDTITDVAELLKNGTVLLKDGSIYYHVKIYKLPQNSLNILNKLLNLLIHVIYPLLNE